MNSDDLERDFTKVLGKFNFSWWVPKPQKRQIFCCFYTLWMFEGQIYPSHVHETSENCRTGFLLCLRTSTKFQLKISRGKKYGRF